MSGRRHVDTYTNEYTDEPLEIINLIEHMKRETNPINMVRNVKQKFNGLLAFIKSRVKSGLIPIQNNQNILAKIKQIRASIKKLDTYISDLRDQNAPNIHVTTGEKIALKSKVDTSVREIQNEIDHVCEYVSELKMKRSSPQQHTPSAPQQHTPSAHQYKSDENINQTILNNINGKFIMVKSIIRKLNIKCTRDVWSRICDHWRSINHMVGTLSAIIKNTDDESKQYFKQQVISVETLMNSLISELNKQSERQYENIQLTYGLEMQSTHQPRRPSSAQQPPSTHQTPKTQQSLDGHELQSAQHPPSIVRLKTLLTHLAFGITRGLTPQTLIAYLTSKFKVDQSVITSLKQSMPNVFSTIQRIKSVNDVINALTRFVSIIVQRQNINVKNGLTLLAVVTTVFGLNVYWETIKLKFEELMRVNRPKPSKSMWKFM